MLNINELRKSHAEGFGGSDAAIFAKIAECESQLNVSERRRIRQALGVEPIPEEGWSTPATVRGHEFEEAAGDIIRQKMPWAATTLTAEYKLEANLAKNFKIFAHADYFDAATGTVFECKNTIDDAIDAVGRRYYAQLQWYYLFPEVKAVHLVWHDDKQFEFTRANTSFRGVCKNADYVDDLKAAIQALDEEADIFRTATDEAVMTTATATAEVAEAVETLKCATIQIKAVEKIAEGAKHRLLAAMEAAGVLKLEWPEVSVAYVAATTARVFDKNALAAAHPELDLSAYEKESCRKASLRITLKNK